MPATSPPPDPVDLERALAESDAPGAASLAGPLRVLATAERAAGGHVHEVAASRLVAVDEADPTLADVSVGVPVTARIEVDAGGAVVRVSVAESDAATTREARTFARNLIVNGAVRGLPASGRRVRRGPPIATRSTHELSVDERGRKVIRRTGFTVSPGLTQRRGG